MMNQRGFTLIEIILALTVVAIALTGLIGAISFVAKQNVQTEIQTTATELAQERMEQLIAEKSKNGLNSSPVLDVTSSPSYVPIPGFSGYEQMTEICYANIPVAPSWRVSASTDDAEEWVTGPVGTMYLNSSDLEFSNDTGPDDDVTAGMRFLNIPFPQGSTITNAYLLFRAENTDSEADTINFYGQAIDNAPTFTSATNNITSRTKTTASVSWNAPSWTSGNDYQTPNIAPIIQQVVNRPGWASGNSLVIIVTATPGARRSARTYDGVPGEAPLLLLDYTPGGGDITKTNPCGSGGTAGYKYITVTVRNNGLSSPISSDVTTIMSDY